MDALLVSAARYHASRVVPFNPFADRAGMAVKKNAILAQLSEERAKARPNALLVEAYELWLRVYRRNVASRA
jgi:hypothetical protein